MDSFLHFERTNLIKLFVRFLAATFKFLAFIGVKIQIIETGFLLFEYTLFCGHEGNRTRKTWTQSYDDYIYISNSAR